MAELIFGEEVLAYLVAQNVVRRASTATGAGLPVAWVDPDEGAPEPDIISNPDQETVVTVMTGPEIPSTWHMGFMQERAMEIRVRAKSRPVAELLCRSVRGKMEEKKHIMMGQMLVQQSKLWRGTQMLPTARAEGSSDDNSVTLTQSFRVAVRIADLTA